MSLSSPGHAVSLFRRQPFREGFWVGSRGFARRDAQTQRKVQTVHLQAKSWCELSPKAAKPPFFIDSGRNVWHWRSLQRRSKNGVLELARPCCVPVPEAAFLGRLLGQKSWFCRSWCQTQPKVQTVHLEAKSWCELSPKAAKPPFFIDSGRDVWHWRSLQRRSKNGVLELSRPCCFPVPEAAFSGRLLGRKSWFCPSWRPNATEGANGVFRRQLEVQIEPHSCKTSFFYRFWTRRLTLKITPTQVEKLCLWARQAMLFPRSGGSLFGKAFGSEVVVLPVVIPKRNRRCKRCISKPNRGANWAPKLQNLLFL